MLVWEDDVDQKVGELVRVRGRGTGVGFYNEKDCAIANILRVSSLREHNGDDKTTPS